MAGRSWGPPGGLAGGWRGEAPAGLTAAGLGPAAEPAYDDDKSCGCIATRSNAAGLTG